MLYFYLNKMSDIEVNSNEDKIKRYSLPKINNTDQIKNKMIADSLKDERRQRFGFFSILHSNFLGDEYYSFKNNLKRDNNGKLILEPRGIYIKPNKKGKFIDSYFDAGFIREDKNLRNKIEKISKLEQERKIEKVKKSKEKSDNYKQTFKPAGVQEYKDLIYPDTMNYKVSIWKDHEKGKNIDFKSRKIETERRGIYTQSSKKGEPCFKGVLFSYNKIPKELYLKYQELSKNEYKEKIIKLKEKREKKEFKRPFIPNSVNKCDTFQTNKELFSLNKDSLDKLNNSYEMRIKNSQSKRKDYVEHVSQFKPSSLIKTGEQGYFEKLTYKVIPIPKKEINLSKQELKKIKLGSHEKEFQLNRLVDSSKFSPSIQTSLSNLKIEYSNMFK